MVILKEITEVEAAELFGVSSQGKRADSSEDREDKDNDAVPRGLGLSEKGFTAHKRKRGIEKSEVSAAAAPDDASKRKPGLGESVLVGALATGLNGPTWWLTKVVLLALAVSLALLLHVALKSSSWVVLLNVIFLIFIACGLVLGLSWFVSQTGFVTVEKQMEELKLTDEGPDSTRRKIN